MGDMEFDLPGIETVARFGLVDEPFAQKLIHTVRGVGYVLEDRT
jgi:hypothetical protein